MLPIEKSQLAHAVTTLPSDDPIGGMLIGRSQALLNVIAAARQIASHPGSTVLIQGESGTGKDVIARAIHELGHASSPTGVFVPINCAAIPEPLLETELFGVEAGAYTDAKVSRDGLLTRAHRGTLFLDEIGSMPLVLQSKLLRFLEARNFRRVGGTKELHVDLRIISATNIDLQSAVAMKTFRNDLFYRLSVFPILMPPLRERREDIPLLVAHFLQREEKRRGLPFRISDEALELLVRHTWPGNVRELQNVLERCSILCTDQIIQPLDIQRAMPAAPNTAQQVTEILQKLQFPDNGINLPALLGTIEQTFIQEALKRSGGNQVHAAQLLGLSRDKLRYRLVDKASQVLRESTEPPKRTLIP
ncbi:hypothetical protein KDA_09470 [Dictyobacter alpinus]|uniref:Sigma-54 factor interaction domain-containing protein n=1 Tax=Dictyobacter alpinus TaxID=2014873 RepID=A0A402B299_9CHLR|nr:sigma-54 dependent transcriptional regulator [Dictyobacter alpinus]GCE25463.1 hypothetical protein KDA_09470 [Dictyobacter alpinus]